LKSVVKGKIRKIDSERLSGVLPEVADHTSKRERIAMEAEREIVELKKLQFMKDKTGEEYEGFISGVTPFGFFVELIEYFVEGLVHVSTLRSDFYHYVEKQHSLVGENTGETLRIGDRIRVVVALVSLEKRQIDFNLADDRPAGKKRVVMEAAPDKGKIAKKGKPAGKKSKSTAKNSSRNKTVTGAKRGRGGRKS